MSPTNALRDALEQIKRDCGKVCPDFATCEHEACRSSYTAWAIAERALEAVPVEPEALLVKCPGPESAAAEHGGTYRLGPCSRGKVYHVRVYEGTAKDGSPAYYNSGGWVMCPRCDGENHIESRPTEPEAWEYGIDHVGLGSGLLVGYRNIGAVRRWLADAQCSGQIVRREPAKPPGPWERVDLRARLCPMSGDDCPHEGPTHSDGSPFGPCDECDGRPQDGGER